MLSPADAAFVARAPDLPGLGVLLDPERFGAALTEALPESGVRRVRIEYLRYKPATSCLASFTVETAGGPVLLYAKAHRPDARDKLEKGRFARSYDNALGPVRFVLEKESIEVHVFPDDRKLRALSRLGRAGKRERLFERLFPGLPRLRSATAQTLRYKPERRYVAALRDGGDGPLAVLRLYSSSSWGAANRNAGAFASRGPLRVPAVIGRSDRDRAIALQWLTGGSLADALPDSIDAEELRRIGEALALFQAQAPGSLSRAKSDEPATELRAAAAGIAASCPPLAARARKLAKLLVARLAEESPVPRSLHGDLHRGQILLSVPGVALLDTDRARSGDPAYDLGSLFADVENSTLRGRLSPDVAENLFERILEGYCRESKNSPGSARIELQKAAALLRIAPQPFRLRERDWPDRTEALLDRAWELLERTSPRTEKRLSPTDPFRAAEDGAIPFLALALDSGEVERHLPARIPALAARAGRFSVNAIRVVRHKPGRRCLIEYDVDGVDRTGTATLLGKVRARGADAATCRAVSSLWNRGFDDASRDGISVPEPLGVVPELGMWVQRKVAGSPATAVLPGPAGPRLARRIAHALHKLHRGIPPQRRHTTEDELRILAERLLRAASERPEWGSRPARLLEMCRGLAAELPRVPPAPIHRDFYPDHVIVAPDRIWLVDFDLYCAGDPALDAGNFLAHLIEQGVRFPGDAGGLDEAAASFEECFAELSGEDARRRAQIYTVLSLARHVSLSLEIPGRAPFSGAILEVCEERASAERVAATRREVATGGARS